MATGSKLVIVESPTKAKKIGGYLGSGYTVMASVGHIRDLAQPSQVPAAEKASTASSAWISKTGSSRITSWTQQEENRCRPEKRAEEGRHPLPRH